MSLRHRLRQTAIEPESYALIDLYEAAAELRTAELRIDHDHYTTRQMYERKHKATERFHKVIDALIEAAQKDLTSTSGGNTITP